MTEEIMTRRRKAAGVKIYFCNIYIYTLELGKKVNSSPLTRLLGTASSSVDGVCIVTCAEGDQEMLLKALKKS